jgi:hypothetical protein
MPMDTPGSDQLNIPARVADTVEMKAARARRTATSNYVLTMIIGLGILSLFLFAGPLTEAIKIEQLQKAASESTERARMQLATLQEESEKTSDLIRNYTVILSEILEELKQTKVKPVTDPSTSSKGSRLMALSQVPQDLGSGWAETDRRPV